MYKYEANKQYINNCIELRDGTKWSKYDSIIYPLFVLKAGDEKKRLEMKELLQNQGINKYLIKSLILKYCHVYLENFPFSASKFAFSVMLSNNCVKLKYLFRFSCYIYRICFKFIS